MFKTELPGLQLNDFGPLNFENWIVFRILIFGFRI
jgi:hypothetical protein